MYNPNDSERALTPDFGKFINNHINIVDEYAASPIQDPERNLLWAFLLQAVVDYCMPALEVEKILSTDDWFAVTAVRDWVHDNTRAAFGFLWVCDQLELDAEHIRETLESYREKGIKIRKPFTRRGR